MILTYFIGLIKSNLKIFSLCAHFFRYTFLCVFVERAMRMIMSRIRERFLDKRPVGNLPVIRLLVTCEMTPYAFHKNLWNDFSRNARRRPERELIR